MNIEQSPAAFIIFAVNIVVSLYALYGKNSLLYKFLLRPYDVVQNNRWHLIITSGFLHGDLTHLLFNMISFFFFAFQLEAIIGTANFLIVYFGCLILSDIPTIIKHKDNYDYGSLGASGAISGVIFGSILFYPLSTIYIFFFPLPALAFAVLFLLYGWWASRRGMDFINHSAHNWGAVSGILLTLLVYPSAWDIFVRQVF